MLYEFDRDTQVTAVGADHYRGTLTEHWSVGDVPNGGYVTGVAMAALRQALPELEPVSVTTHYLRPGAPGDVGVRVERIKQGKRYTTVAASLKQAHGEVVRVLATYGRLDPCGGAIHLGSHPPALDPPEDEMPRRDLETLPAIVRRFDLRLPTASANAPGETRAWIRFIDHRPMDVHCLPLITDSFPPSVFNLVAPGWVPTIELTVHIRARPRGEWLAGAFRTRFLFDGMLEEDGELWDQTGQLVASSRQLALTPRQG
jgi:acyl-CoA thioesterase